MFIFRLFPILFLNSEFKFRVFPAENIKINYIKVYRCDKLKRSGLVFVNITSPGFFVDAPLPLAILIYSHRVSCTPVLLR